MSLLKLEDVSKRFVDREYFWQRPKVVEAVKGVNLQVHSGTCLGLVGESGCGKSTLARVISGLEKPTQGQVLFNGDNIHTVNKKKAFQLRRELQFVFQDSFGSVNQRHTAEKILLEPLKNFLKLSPEEEQKEINELLKLVGLSSEDRYKYPHQFSGGQLQRICIARAISVRPKLVILDEPLSSLDVSVQAQIMNLLVDLKEKYNLSYLLISHDLEAVHYIADALVVMYQGTIVEYIEDISLFESLNHPYTQKLLLSILPKYPRNRVELIPEFNEPMVSDQKLVGCAYAKRCTKTQEICFKQAPELRAVSNKHWRACHYC